MEKYKYCDALIRAVSGIHIDKNLTDKEKLEYENILLELRDKLMNDNLLEKSSIAEGLKRIADISCADDKTTILFDSCKLTNLLGNNIEKVVDTISGNISVGIK